MRRTARQDIALAQAAHGMPGEPCRACTAERLQEQADEGRKEPRIKEDATDGACAIIASLGHRDSALAKATRARKRRAFKRELDARGRDVLRDSCDAPSLFSWFRLGCTGRSARAHANHASRMRFHRILAPTLLLVNAPPAIPAATTLESPGNRQRHGRTAARPARLSRRAVDRLRQVDTGCTGRTHGCQPGQVGRTGTGATGVMGWEGG